MRVLAIGLMATILLLSGCKRFPDDTDLAMRKGQGRFSGIGIFDAGKMWAQMAGSGSPADPAQANLADDDYIIAVVDSQTGEVRQCGNHSGYCVAMKPWASAAPAHLPIKLMKHASDLAREDQAAIDASQKTK